VPGPVRILLATRNGAAHLGAQLQSYLAQEHRDWALWASDDGSTDGTWQILEDFAARHPDREIRLVRGPGRGAAANFLSLLTHPDLPPGPVTLSDQDDVWLPHRIGRALDAVSARSEPVLYGSTTIETRPDLTPLRRRKGPLPPPSFHNALVQNIVAGNTATLNAAALAALRRGGAPEVPYHDWWLYLRLSGIGAHVVIDDEPLLYYRQHAGAVIGAHTGLPARLARLRALTSGRYRDWIRANLTGLLAHPDDLLPDHAAAARILRDMPDRVRALRQSGARRSSPLYQSLLYLLAGTGRL
jgi:glycosyltransferase involved in cell wall biosynthesis